MNEFDVTYLKLLKEIIDSGYRKVTRAGETLSLFGKSMSFDLRKGIPLLTTKKVFYKGIIHELLWFLSGNTNITYLVKNNVHIWDDDAYRWYLEKWKNFNENVKEPLRIPPLSKEEFIAEINENGDYYSPFPCYHYGDLGPIYGKQWRRFGYNNVDQISNVIKALKNNPDDRRMLIIAFNPDMLQEMALPPCHIMFQFYTRELSNEERWKIYNKDEPFDNSYDSIAKLLENNIPTRELSCMFTMRSNDFCCGNPYNICQYAILTYMIAEVCNMTVGDLIFNGGDVHVYTNHLDGVCEQLQRQGSNEYPQLKFSRHIDNIFDFQYEDFIIDNYYPDKPIKYQLNVGL